MSPQTQARAVSRSDAAGLHFFVVAGVVIAAWTVITAVRRIAEVVARVDVPVLVAFDGTAAAAPIGPGGADAPVSVAGVVGFLGFGAVPFFGNIGANGVVAQDSDRGFDNRVMSVDLFALLVLGFVAALVFTVGDRLQRETAGLV